MTDTGVEFTVGVVGHVDRAQMVNELVDQLLPHVKLANTDNGALGCSGNHAHVLSRLVNEDGWAVILEDDALPQPDFYGQLETALWLVQEQLSPSIKVVSLYLGTGYPHNWQRRVEEALQGDPCFIVAPRLLHAVGYCIAPEVKSSLSAYMSKRPRGPGMAPDEAISVWARANGYEVAYTNPSLVDHRDTPTVLRARAQTFAPGRKRPRKAWNAGQRLTWTDSVATMSQ